MQIQNQLEPLLLDLKSAHPNRQLPQLRFEKIPLSVVRFVEARVDDDPDDVEGLVTDLHAVNTTLESHGFGPGLLCSLLPFTDGAGRTVGVLYLYKQGTFYPFAPSPQGGKQRDTLLAIQLRDLLAGELPVEAERSRWLAVWGAPGL